MSQGSLVLGPVAMSNLALSMLDHLARLQPAVDDQGSVLQPLPRVHRLLCSLEHFLHQILHPTPCRCAGWHQP